MAKTYTGERTGNGAEAWVDGDPLPSRRDLREISDDGLFEWSYVGDGPRQLAFALLMDHLGDRARAEAALEAFTRDVVANFGNDWELTSADIDTALRNAGAL